MFEVLDTSVQILGHTRETLDATIYLVKLIDTQSSADQWQDVCSVVLLVLLIA